MAYFLNGDLILESDKAVDFGTFEINATTFISDSEVQTISGTLQAEIDTNTTHTGGDGSDHADVATNTSHSTGDGSDHADVASNTSAISDNTTLIGTTSGTLQTAIDGNASDISTNTGDISTNTGDISTNVSAIASNTASIAVVSGTADTNASDISTNAGDISTNASAIADNTTLIVTTSGVLNDKIVATENAAATTYYLHEDSADIGGYELLRSSPAEDPESYDSVVIGSGDGETAMDSYVTTSGEPNTTSIPAGTWTWVLWADISSTVSGPHYLRAKWYRREQGGTEHYLFQHEQAITSTDQTRYFIEASTSGIDMSTTDRLVVKMYAEIGSAGDRTIGYYVEGVNHPTRFNTPVLTSLITDHGELTGLSDDDHTAYHTDGRAASWLSANHETTYTHADIATNTSHTGGDGSDHADVATNTTHSTGDGSDHADVAQNTSDIAANTALIATTSGTLQTEIDSASSVDDGNYTIASGVSTFTVDFSPYYLASDYILTGIISNVVDANPLKITPVVTNQTIAGFDIALSAATDSANYTLAWQLSSGDLNTDVVLPTCDSVVLSSYTILAGETPTVTITFSEPVYNFSNSDVTFENGTCTTLVSGDGDTTWSGVFTPTEALEDDTNVITVGTNYTDLAGNAPLAGNTSSNYVIDTSQPTILITDDTPGTAISDVTFTFTFSEDVTGFTAGDIDVTGGSKGAFTPISGSVYTLVVTPTDDSTTNITVDVGSGVCQDSTGNPNAAAEQAVQPVDTVEPTIDSVVLSSYAYKVAETGTLTITMSEPVINFDNTDLTVENGNVPSISSGDGGTTWSGTFTPTDDVEDNSNVISVGTAFTDVAGNAPLAGNSTSNYTIDTKEPVCDSIVMSDNALKVGDTSTLTITFSEPVTNFDNTDVTLENGTLTPVESADGGVTWTGTFTPTDDIEDATNVISIGTSYTDIAGNAPLAGNSTSNYTIDTKEPVIESVVMSDSALKVGETSTLTITFSEAVNNFDNSDITLANGTLTPIESADGGVTWTGTFTPTDNIEDGSNTIFVANTMTDLAGNAPIAGNSSANYTIDTKEPTCDSIVMSDPALKVGETSTLTITFSEPVINFTNADITLENGTLTPVESADGGVTWTGTFTPTDDIEDATNVISVGTAYTDAAGNAPLAGNTSANYTIDTIEPTVEITDDTPGTAIDDVEFTFTWSEAVTGFVAGDIDVTGGTKATFTPVSSTVYTQVVAPTSDSTANITIDIDADKCNDSAGNGNEAVNQYIQAVDTVIPTIDSVVMSDYTLTSGEVSLVTITFSENMTNFDNSDVTFENGTCTPLSSPDGGTTWSGTFTPTPSIVDGTNVIYVATTMTDIAGNAPLAGNTSANYTIDTT